MNDFLFWFLVGGALAFVFGVGTMWIGWVLADRFVKRITGEKPLSDEPPSKSFDECMEEVRRRRLDNTKGGRR